MSKLKCTVLHSCPCTFLFHPRVAWTWWHRTLEIGEMLLAIILARPRLDGTRRKTPRGTILSIQEGLGDVRSRECFACSSRGRVEPNGERDGLNEGSEQTQVEHAKRKRWRRARGGGRWERPGGTNVTMLFATFKNQSGMGHSLHSCQVLRSHHRCG